MKILLVRVTVLFGLLPILSIGQKNQELTEDQLKIWWQKDLENDTIPGISLERAYDEILEGKKGEEVVVAVLDTKIDVDHEDIKDQLWVNEDEIPDNGIDDDNNGYVDDNNGWNFLGNSDGRDVDYQLAESVRVIKRYGPKYDSIGASQVPEDEQEAYRMFQKAKWLYENDVADMKANIKYMDSVSMVFKRARDTVAHFLGSNDFQPKQIDSLGEVYPDLSSDLAYFKRISSYGLTEDAFAENIDLFQKYLDSMYNPAFEDRKIQADDPYDLADSDYGNNIVFNNELNFQHATPVSALIAATRDNDLGIDGISNNIKLMPVVMVATGDENDKDVYHAIRYAVDNGADIINMSWGKYISPKVEWVRDAFRYAAEHDVLLVSAAGNDAKNTDVEINFPNDNIAEVEFVDNFIMAGASSYSIDSTLIASFSNYGKNTVDIFAPGDQIYSADVDNQYRFARGTSFASPLAAGVAALVKSYYPYFSANELKRILLESGTPIDWEVIVTDSTGTSKKVPFKELSKTGKLLNAYNALKMAERITSENIDKVKQKD